MAKKSISKQAATVIEDSPVRVERPTLLKRYGWPDENGFYFVGPRNDKVCARCGIWFVRLEKCDNCRVD